MAQNSSIPANNPANRALRIIRSEPKKAVMLSGLLMMMGLLWLKVLAGGRTMPAGAQGAVELAPATIKPAAMVSDVGKGLLEWRKQNPKPLARNLFQIQYERFATDGAAHAPQSAQSGFWEQINKSMDFKSDQEKVRASAQQDRNDAISKEAAKLKPKASLSVNGTRTAVIEGGSSGLASEGDVINGFRILRIAADRIVVEKEGLRLEVMPDGKVRKVAGY